MAQVTINTCDWCKTTVEGSLYGKGWYGYDPVDRSKSPALVCFDCAQSCSRAADAARLARRAEIIAAHALKVVASGEPEGVEAR